MTMTDDELDSVFGDSDAVPPPRGYGEQPTQAVVPQHVPPPPFYPLPPGLGQTQDGSLLTKQVAGLPVWGWGALLTAVAGGAYFFFKARDGETKKNSDDEETTPNHGHPLLPASTGHREKWEPGRTATGDILKSHFTRKGSATGLVVYTDAEEAKKKLKHVSPLVNFKLDGYKVDKELTKICKKEGLKPIQHEDGSVGLYPLEGTRRGREWEIYVDELRDDGQTV